MKLESRDKMIIAGPCALESRQVAEETIEGALRWGVEVVRANLWKPRTNGGFRGAEDAGLEWVRMMAREGLTPALEVGIVDHVVKLRKEVLDKVPDSKLLLWLGSRNQNQWVQTEIGKEIAGDERITMMVKNQPWRSEAHWAGIVGYLIEGGASKDQLMLCHRGFNPGKNDETDLRNIPDVAMALRLRAELDLKLIMDPSHIGGRRDLVKSLIQEYQQVDGVDGQIIEVHPDPDNALTDAKQQLTWAELAAVMGWVNEAAKEVA